LYKTVWFNNTRKLLVVNQHSHSKYTQRLISVVGKHSIRLYKVDRHDHGSYSCRALFITTGPEKIKSVREDVLLFVKGES